MSKSYVCGGHPDHQGGDQDGQEGKYQPSGAVGTRLPSLTPHHLQNLTVHLIKNGRRGLEKGLPLRYWTLRSTFA